MKSTKQQTASQPDLLLKMVSQLWKISTPPGKCFSGDFSPEEFSNALQRSTVDQVTLLTQEIKDIFLAERKAGAVFADLTVAYDTVWHRGLTCKAHDLIE